MIMTHISDQLYENILHDCDCDEDVTIALLCSQLATLASYDVVKNIILYQLPSDIVIPHYVMGVNDTQCRITIYDAHIDVVYNHQNNVPPHKNDISVTFLYDGDTYPLVLSPDSQRLFFSIIENVSAAHGRLFDVYDWATVCIVNRLKFQCPQYKNQLLHIWDVISGEPVLNYMSDIHDNTVTFSSDTDNIDVTITLEQNRVSVHIRINDDNYDMTMDDNESYVCARDVLIRVATSF